MFKEVSVFDSSEIVEVMPGVMATSLLYAQHRSVAKRVGFLAKRPPVLVCHLLRRMVPCLAMVRGVSSVFVVVVLYKFCRRHRTGYLDGC